MTATFSLRGRRILVVEDEFFIADEISEALSQEGVEVIGPVPTVAGALALLDDAARIDGALLDVNLRGEMVWPVLDVLIDRSVPVVLTTGYDERTIPASYAHLPHREKPVAMYDLISALKERQA